MQVVWYGTRTEAEALNEAIAHNCECEFGVSGARMSTCASHRMLTEDQRALNGLLFVRRISPRLLREEVFAGTQVCVARCSMTDG